MSDCTGDTCFCKKPKPPAEDEPKDMVLGISLKRIPQISAYLESVRGGDEDTLKLRIAELSQENWTQGEWNAFGIAARAMLLNHPAYSQVLRILQEKGGY